MSGDAQILTAALKGRWHGRYGTACCPAHGDRTPSLSLSNAPDGRLLLRCHTGCTFLAILDALRGLWLAEGTGRAPGFDPAQLAQREAEERREAEKKARQARTIWQESRSIEGTPAALYLRGRGIACPLPDTLRYHPAAWHPSAQRLPAMVALVEGAERFALHRTYLRPDGSGKAAIEPAKAMLGCVKGGAVRLTHDAGPLVVCEGIETGLSLASGLLRTPATIWAALSTSGMQKLDLPPFPSCLTVATDGDPAGREAGHALATRADALGWTVSLLPAPEGRDWNDIIMKGARA